jgi:cytidylate kinase
MTEHDWADHLLRALARINARHRAEAGDEAWPGEPPAFTIALSRTTGALGTSVARVVGSRLGWKVYDHELLEQIARDMNVRVGLLEGVAEKHVSWIREMMEAFSAGPQVNEQTYLKHLVGTVLSLGARGRCVLVGRGAAHFLPAARTLRVRLTAPLDFRVAVISRERGLSREQARRFIEKSDRERARFLREHFLADPEDSARYDLILNAARFGAVGCAELIVEGLHHLEAVAAAA